MSGSVASFNSTSAGSLWSSVSASVQNITSKTAFIDFYERVRSIGDLAVLKSNIYINDRLYVNDLNKEVRGPYTLSELSTVSAYEAWKDNATVLPYGEFIRLSQVTQHLDSYDFASPLSASQISLVLKYIIKSAACAGCDILSLVADHVFLRDTAGVIYRAAVLSDGTVGEYKVFYIPHYTWGLSDFDGLQKILNLNDTNPVLAAILDGRIAENRKLKNVVIPHFLVSLDTTAHEIKRLDTDAAGAGLFNSRIYMESLDLSYIIDLSYFKGTVGATMSTVGKGSTLTCLCTGNNYLFPRATALTSVVIGPQTIFTGVANAFADSIVTDIKIADNGMYPAKDISIPAVQSIYSAPYANYGSSVEVTVHVPVIHTLVAPATSDSVVNEEDEQYAAVLTTAYDPAAVAATPTTTGEGEQATTSTASFEYPAKATVEPTFIYHVYSKTLLPAATGEFADGE